MKDDSARSRRQAGLRRAAVLAALAGAALAAACSASPASAPGSGTGEPTAQRINVLTSALRLMQRDYGRLREEPGPVDVLDYQVGDLWKRGIDGTETTVAVIEAWNSSPLTAPFMASRDQMLGLPNPQITTIYPTGRHRLPASCPPAWPGWPATGRAKAGRARLRSMPLRCTSWLPTPRS